MGQGPLRWIAIALIGAMVAALAVALVAGGGEPSGADGGTTADDGARGESTATEVLDGPHVVVELCVGVACPELDDAGQQALVAEIEADPRVASVLLVSSEQAYQLFLDRFGDQEDLVASVQPEEVPARVELDLFDPQAVPTVLSDYEQRDGVARVYDARTVAP